MTEKDSLSPEVRALLDRYGAEGVKMMGDPHFNQADRVVLLAYWAATLLDVEFGAGCPLCGLETLVSRIHFNWHLAHGHDFPTHHANAGTSAYKQ
jgi:hypothetical protein